jgi:hypothetical protein
MARASWFDDTAEHPVIQEQVEKLASFTSTMEDGIVSTQELQGQEQRVVTAMKSVESELTDDALHSKVTTMLVEMTAYNVMRLLHELQVEHTRRAFSKA